MALGLWILLTPLRTLGPRAFSVSVALVGSAYLLAADTSLVLLPSVARQVPQSWFTRFGPVSSYALYGLELGMGVGVGSSPYGAAYAVFLFGGLLGSAPVALVLGTAFGLGRGGLVGPISILDRVVWADGLYHRPSRELSVLSMMTTLVLAAAALLVPMT
jgi:hypothetical protein